MGRSSSMSEESRRCSLKLTQFHHCLENSCTYEDESSCSMTWKTTSRTIISCIQNQSLTLAWSFLETDTFLLLVSLCLAIEVCIISSTLQRRIDTPKKTAIKTSFFSIERLTLTNSLITINGCTRDSLKKEVQKYEIFNLAKKKGKKQHRISKKIKQVLFVDQYSTSFLMLTSDSLYLCEEKNSWKTSNIILPVGSSTKFIDMVLSESGLLLILSEDKKLLQIENYKDITNVYDLELVLEDVPTSISIHRESLSIGCLRGYTYISDVRSPQKLYEQPLPPHFGFGASEEPDIKEYPDTMILKLTQDKMLGVFSDKTIVIFDRKSDLEAEVSHIIQNHAKGIHNIQMIPNECSDTGFTFLSGSTDKTLRKWLIEKNGHGSICSLMNSALLCDDFSHLKKPRAKQKLEEEQTDDLGQIRVIQRAIGQQDDIILCGDSCGYVWIFDSETFLLRSIRESHQDEILDISFVKTKDSDDPRDGMIISCSRDKTVKSFVYSDEELKDLDNFTSSSLPIIGLDYIKEEKGVVKLVYIDANSNLCIREILPECRFDSPIIKNMSPRKFYSLAVRDNKIAIGTDTKIQLGELKDNNYWALMKSAGGNQSKMKDFVKLEIEDTNTFVISSCWKSHDVHVIDMINSRVVGSFNCGEPVLNIKISPDHKYLITTSSKGCFYVWKLPLRIVASMKFRENQKDLLSNHPSLDNNNMALSKIKEDDELSDDNDFCDVDEGKREEPRRKEWAKIDKRPSNFGSQPPPTILDKSSSENVRLKTEVELFEDTALDITNKSDNDQESDNEEDVFDLLNSPTGHEEENFKTKYEFTGIVEKKRRASYIRRDSKIGKLKEKANNLKSDSSWEDRKHSSCLDDNARIRSHNVEKQFIDFSDGHQNKRSVIQRFTGYEHLEESSSKDELKKEVTQISKSIDKCIRVMQIQGSLTNDPEISQLMILLNMKMNTLQNAYFHSMLSTNLSTKHDGPN